MLDNYSICAVCSEMIEKRKGIWWDINGKCVTSSGGVHKHTPTNPDTYRSHKYGSDIRTEILSAMSDYGMVDEVLGDSETFGYFELFEDFNAILEYDSQGFVYSTHYDTPEMARNAWDHLSTDYAEWCEEDEEDSEPDYSESDEYDSDLWDINPYED